MTAARPEKTFAFLCLLLALGTAALYSPITQHPFILFDDEQYVTSNPHVYQGLSAENIRWAFTSGEAANWHPLTWLSHQLDCTLFGQNAGGHHFINLLFHVANTLLLFVFLRSATGALWRSAFVAALFAWHPSHVESVAWAAERKDVLSAFFFLLTLLAYAKYGTGAKGRTTSTPPTQPLTTCHPSLFNLLALAFFACGLMSKPMVVTLPFILLLLDCWPLNRIQNSEFRIQNLKRLLVEKIPFFALSLGSCVVTFLSQRGAGAVSPVEWPYRLTNVPVAYARYLAKLFWPNDLVIVYPYVYHWPTLAIAGSILLITIVSVLAGLLFWRRPWLACGWFWFLGMLVPVIGLVQVGAQAMADRYTYLPSIGIFIALVWGAAAVVEFKPHLKRIIILLGGGGLAGLLMLTSTQISYWRSDISLFRHALEVTADNYVAANCLGRAYEKNGDQLRARECFRIAVTSEPRFPQSQFNLANCQFALGEKADGLNHLQAAAALTFRDPEIQLALGSLFSKYGSWTNAANCLSNSIFMRADFAIAHANYAHALVNLGQFAPAAAHFRQALKLQPNFPDAQKQLSRLQTDHPELK